MLQDSSRHLLVAFIGLLFLERIHEIGDYWLQNSWMAYGKGFKILPAFIHSFIYYAVFSFFFHLFDWLEPKEVGVPMTCLRFFLVGVSHFLIDHYQIPALYAFWINGKLRSSYEDGERQYVLFPEEKITWEIFWGALIRRRWAILPPPVPAFVILAIDQSWHKTFNAIAFFLTVLL